MDYENFDSPKHFRSHITELLQNFQWFKVRIMLAQYKAHVPPMDTVYHLKPQLGFSHMTGQNSRIIKIHHHLVLHDPTKRFIPVTEN